MRKAVVSPIQPSVVDKVAPAPPSPFPAALCDFMLKNWRAQRRKLPPKVRGLRYFAQRRARLSEAFAQDLLVVPTGHEKVRANDTYYPFRPGSDFYYLTGNLEPDCVLVMVPKRFGDAAGAEASASPARHHHAFLFVEPNPGRSDVTFFTDRNKGELWVGPRLGVTESAHRFGVTGCLPLAELPERLAAWRAQAAGGRQKKPSAAYRLVRGFDDEVVRPLAGAGDEAQAQRDAELAEWLSEARLIKDAHEVRALERACASTARGFDDVIGRLRTGKSEREVEGVFNLRARMEGNAVGYNTIAASGHHACVLHWQHNDGGLNQNELLLLDAGVEGHELYTADVTRTLPIGGKFSPAQSDVYDLVLQAQAAAFAAVRPGRDFMEPNARAMEVLTYGLVQMGILPDAADALHPAHQYYKRYTLHMVSHMLGIDVHDCAAARAQTYKYGKLQPGMVLTVEPGLYFQRDDLTVPAKYRGIGVRIEDDVLVTARGMRILSELPRERREVERWMADVWRKDGRGAGAARVKTRGGKR